MRHLEPQETFCQTDRNKTPTLYESNTDNISSLSFLTCQYQPLIGCEKICFVDEKKGLFLQVNFLHVLVKVRTPEQQRIACINDLDHHITARKNNSETERQTGTQTDSTQWHWLAKRPPIKQRRNPALNFTHSL